MSPPREGIILPFIASGFGHHVRSVLLDVDLIFDKTVSTRLVFGHNLSILDNWVLEGHLTSITLVAQSISGRNHLTHRQFERVLSHRTPGYTYSRYIKELKLGTCAHSSLSTIRRRFIIDTGSPNPEAITWYPRLRIQPRCGNPMELLSEVANTWGGRLEVNGLLAYNNGTCVDEEIFLEQSDPHQYHYKDDLYLWMMTQIVKDPIDGKHIGTFLLNMDRQSRYAYYRKFEAQLQALKELHGIRQIVIPKSNTRSLGCHVHAG